MEMGRIRLLILWLRWKLFRQPSVVLIDFDGSARARVCRGYKKWKWAKRYGLNIANVILLEDGRTQGVCYVKRWEPLFPASPMQPS